LSTTEPTTIPERVRRLPELASDLWWTWNPQARQVFRKLDYPLWRQTAHNPVLMLRLVSADMLAKAAVDPSFLLRAMPRSTLDRARSATLVAAALHGRRRHRLFSAGCAPSVAAYLRRGLGVLAGDHCKASDLGIRSSASVRPAGLFPPDSLG
jgi:starch phosphorylase